mmetsp:Transcript_4930/g.7527  ORF Transcript_4930/g.7527 Transcript_4930/m.7527 type:complete len:348 (-) Transcript_4930:157-1200(-)|eukprot:CAMPEP_0185023112 /NCGR_PEP_ID=MMETSP1103-20130426/5801_1 /TAXON_ID=36769 /ORGANISM="Paraphysomonas bandaiensis, Strain Caron Lab Isolate" /LENGTH=347 /DNA_ID=CAMNT_0027555539 /DNA_START=106 /DNA_END=1149 /DNA_ORIENTATION=-
MEISPSVAGGLAALVLAAIGIVVYWVFYPVFSSSSNNDCDGDTLTARNSKSQQLNQIKLDPTLDFSVIVPAYNEEARLPPMLDDTIDFLSTWCQQQSFTFEIIVVDDGSSDDTAGVVKSYIMKHDFVKLLKLGRNRGKGGAIKLGVQRACGRYILMADADGATDIRDLQSLYKSLKECERNGDLKLSGVPEDGVVGMAVGSRAHMEGKSIATRALHRTILMYGFHLLVTILCTRNVKDTQCGFKLFTRRTARILFGVLHLDRWSFDTELVFLAESLNMPITEVAVNWHEVDGSKLIQTGADVAITSLTMARDMLCVRLSYLFGIWNYKCALGENISRLCKSHPKKNA